MLTPAIVSEEFGFGLAATLASRVREINSDGEPIDVDHAGAILLGIDILSVLSGRVRSPDDTWACVEHAALLVLGALQDLKALTIRDGWPRVPGRTSQTGRLLPLPFAEIRKGTLALGYRLDETDELVIDIPPIKLYDLPSPPAGLRGQPAPPRFLRRR